MSKEFIENYLASIEPNGCPNLLVLGVGQFYYQEGHWDLIFPIEPFHIDLDFQP